MRPQLLCLFVVLGVFVASAAESLIVHSHPCGEVLEIISEDVSVKGIGSRSVRCDDMQDARTWVRIEYQGKNGWIPLGDEGQGERYYGSSGTGSSSSGSGSSGYPGTSGSTSGGDGSGSSSSTGYPASSSTSGGDGSGSSSSTGYPSSGSSSGGDGSGSGSTGTYTSSGSSSTTGAPTGTGYAADVSVPVSVSDFNCLKQAGYTRAIVRAYRSSGSADPNAPQTIRNAQSAGLSADIYMFPCPKCSASAAAQVSATVSALSAQNVNYNMFWFDVEGGSTYWSTSATTNQKWLAAGIAQAQQLGLNIGIYTSASQWQPIMGSSSAFASYPLWYAHYDNSASFSDFKPFAGWTKPYMKQFVGDTTRCGVGLDENWWSA